MRVLAGESYLVLTLFAALMAGTVSAQQTITYTDGENNTAPITITASTNPTTLTIASGNATQSGVISDSGTAGQIALTGGGTLVLTGDNTYRGGTTISAGVLQIGDGGTTGSITGDVTDNAAIVFNRSDTAYYGGLGSALSGNGSLTQMGTGTLNLSSIDNFTGTITISSGTIQTNSSTKGDIVDNGSLVYYSNSLLIASSVISGTGGLTVTGAGGSSVFIEGTDTYTGGTTISSGQLVIGNAGVFVTGGNNDGVSGSVIGNITNNANLSFERNDLVSFGGDISGTGSVFKGGNNTLILTGTNTYNGTTRNFYFINGITVRVGTYVLGGTLQIGNGGTTGSITGNVAVGLGAGSNTTLAFDRSDSITFGGDISGTGNLVQMGSGTLKLTGANTYAGGTTIEAGSLKVSADENLGAIEGGVALSGGGELLTDANGFITSRAITLTDTGTLAAVTNTTATYNGSIAGGTLTIGDGLDKGTIVFSDSVSRTGGSGNNGYDYVGGNGGNGATGVIVGNGASFTNDGVVTGGSGGNGGNAFYSSQSSTYLGNGGNGGEGATAVIMDSEAMLANMGTITGGIGGTGGSGIHGGNGGGGGLALSLCSNDSFTNNGTIIGGTGGTGGYGYYGSFGGSGGIAVTESMNASLINNGEITGGRGGGEISNNGENLGATGGVAVVLGTGASLINNSNGTIAGGSGNNGVGFYGSGGAGGVAVTLGTNSTLNNAGEITGGGGGSGSGSSYDGEGGAGGTAVTLATGAGLINTGSISGGLAGSVTSGSPYSGFGGTAITASGGSTIINAGSITGGTGFGGQTNAMVLSGGDNTLELYATSQISGNVLSNGGDTLELGGTIDGAFSVSKIGGTSTQYQGFSQYFKTGTSNWSLTGNVGNVGGGVLVIVDGIPTPSPGAPAVTPWTLLQGTLSISSDGNLGNESGMLTFNGGTLQTTATLASSRNVTLNASGGTFDTDGNSTTFSGAISGAGRLALNDSKGTGTLVLGGSNTYAGGTTVTAGTLLANSSNSTGSGAVNVQSDGVLGGNGTIKTSGVTSGAAVTFASGATLNQSIVSGGLGTSTLTLDLHNTGATSTVDLLQGAKFAFNLGASGVSDQAVVTGGTLTLNGQNFSDFTFTTISGFTGVGTYDLFSTDASGDILGSLGITTGTVDGYTATLSVVNARDLQLTLNGGAVPEPSAWTLALCAMMFFAFLRARNRSS